MSDPTLEQIEGLYTAVVQGIGEAFEGFRIETDYPGARVDGPLPAIYVLLTDFSPADAQPGTGQLDIRATFEARIAVEIEDEQLMTEAEKKGSVKSKVQAIAFAAKLSHLVSESSFAVDGVGMGELISAEDENFDRDMPGVEMWLVTWEHAIRIGKNEWEEDGALFPPSRIRGTLV